jgi:hypothetical protein
MTPIIMNNLVLLDRLWIGNTGIIVTQDLVTNEYKFYIQGENAPIDVSETRQLSLIMMYGRHFPEDAGKLLFKHVDFSGKPYKEIYPEQFL